jgi:chromate reductase
MNTTHIPVTLVGISGSLRAASFNRSFLRLLQRVVPDGVSLDIAEISDIPLYNLDVEQTDGFPESVVRLREQVASADGIVIATPEYNFSVPGVLKNAIDWASRHADSPLNHKVTAIAGVAGGSGSRRAQNHLRGILGHNHMRVMARPEMFVASGGRHFDNGEPIEDDFVERTTEWAGAFVSFLTRMRDIPRFESGTVLIVGRDHENLRLSHDLLGEYGMRAIGTLGDGEALEAIKNRGVAAVVVGGGVDGTSRDTLKAALAEHRPDSPFVEITHPDETATSVVKALGLG